MEIQGKITHVLDTRTGSGQKGDWTVYNYVLETSGQYPKQIAFEVFNTDHGLQVGDTIKAQINIESREYNGRWYTAVKAYKVDVQGSKQASPPPRPEMEDNSEDSELPF
jgi:stress response protein SCP2